MIYFLRGRLPYLKLGFSLLLCNMRSIVDRFELFYKGPLYIKTLNAGNKRKEE